VVGYWLVYNSWFNLNTILKALNHLLAQESWASQLLRKHIGKTIQVILPINKTTLVINENAFFSLADASFSGDANVTLTIGSEFFKAYMAGGKDMAAQHVKVSGDVDLAHMMGKLASQLRWDVEEDLSKLVGDAMAHRMVESGKKVKDLSQAAVKDLRDSMVEYLVHERPTLVVNQELNQYKEDVRRLRDDVDRIEKRIERLLEKSV
jgi:ubiquinone biosynthesis accessory factor UbiJ